MVATIEGGCICGTVRYRADAEPVLIAACHCATCRREAGSVFSVNVAVPAGGVVVAGDALTTDEDRAGADGKPFHRAFRGRCGWPLPGRATPAPHVRCAEKQPWVAIPADARRFEGDPA
jgi:hypothetical protein